MPLNEEIVNDVKEELKWEPMIDSEAIGVSAEDGRVTLRGTVATFREKREAGRAAARVFGVVSVDNQLQVSPLSLARTDDAELRGRVLQALMLDSAVPETVDVSVREGVVTLKGTASWQYQREEAEFVAGNVPGAVDIIDDIELEHPPTPRAETVKDEIARAFERNAGIDADRLEVTTKDGTVTIKGRVRSWAEHDDALAAAWAAPGVVAVRDRMTVEY